jgi:outer membrane translocation and assembly module TamA
VTRSAKFGQVIALAVVCLPIIAVSAELRYEANIVGVDDSDLADLLADVSQLKTLDDRLPASEEALRRRAEGDLDRLKEAAHSLGYWNAQFVYQIDTTGDPARVTVTATLGPLYHVAAVEIRGADGRPLALPGDLAVPPLLLKPGDPARAAPVIDAENALLRRSTHRPSLCQAAERRVVVDHDNQTMTVTYTLTPVRRCILSGGDRGFERLDPHVEGRVRWRQGDAYDNRSVDETRKALVRADCSVRSGSPRSPTRPNDPARIDVEAVERAHRTIGAGSPTTPASAGGRCSGRTATRSQAEYETVARPGQQTNGVAANFRRRFPRCRPDLLASPRSPTIRRPPITAAATVSAGLERRFDHPDRRHRARWRMWSSLPLLTQ